MRGPTRANGRERFTHELRLRVWGLLAAAILVADQMPAITARVGGLDPEPAVALRRAETGVVPPA